MKNEIEIFIPTFDRNDKLVGTIAAVLSMRCVENVRITIIDNCSRTPVTETLVHAGIDMNRIEVVRNRCNVGANANILRCFEFATADWIWMIGDSDHPRVDSLTLILSTIEKAPEALRIGFSADEAAGEATGVRGFIDNITSFGRTLFISGAVYKASVLRNQLNIGHHFCYSMAPHIALSLSSLGSCGKSVTVSEDIITAERPDDKDCWPTMPSYLGFSTLLELPALSNLSDMRALARKIVPASQPIVKSFYQLHSKNINREEMRKGQYNATQVALRTVYSSGMVSQVLIFAALRLCVLVPGLPRAVCTLIERRLGRKPIAVNDFRRL